MIAEIARKGRGFCGTDRRVDIADGRPIIAASAGTIGLATVDSEGAGA